VSRTANKINPTHPQTPTDTTAQPTEPTHSDSNACTPPRIHMYVFVAVGVHLAAYMGSVARMNVQLRRYERSNQATKREPSRFPTNLHATTTHHNVPTPSTYTVEGVCTANKRMEWNTGWIVAQKSAIATTTVTTTTATLQLYTDPHTHQYFTQHIHTCPTRRTLLTVMLVGSKTDYQSR